eukprot:10332151-Alexandrium_andersonii.AAC.1
MMTAPPPAACTPHPSRDGANAALCCPDPDVARAPSRESSGRKDRHRHRIERPHRSTVGSRSRSETELLVSIRQIS